MCFSKFLTYIYTLSLVFTLTEQFSGHSQKKIMTEEEPVYEFANNLEDFGYFFNEEGKLRKKGTDEPFEFNVQEGNHHYNQKHYNALGDIITEKIYQMMEKDYKLQRSYLPVNAEEGEPQSFVFISGDLYTNSDKLMILVHGNGVVRAGQWARRLIINDCLDSGTQLPYIKWARENGYAVIVANTNINTGELPNNKKKKPVPIKGNATPEEHMESLWREFVQRCSVKHIAIVAHSYGGVCTLELAKKHLREFEERVFAIALTDSVHGLRGQEAEPEVVSYYKQHVVNWASAYDPLDAPLITTTDEVPTVSAGTDKHENTSYSSMHSIFKFFKEKYEETVNPSNKCKNEGDSNDQILPASDTPARDQGEGEETKDLTNQMEEQAQTDQSGTDMKESGSLEQTESSQSETIPGDHAVTVDEVNPEVKSEL
ncbi:cotranscriptional regulator FAM172A homolog isoform X2 [Mercenaria mercenaria]|uniref:cotranscriptional regulator FAM172A homolog isoform X2 n=1 Tax=Mercenaria mercenaria TaxID=6596 RepID=UPI001E1D88F6|nr:cotranscriptional regulator FAM172A homolog isoform X2 [Mercenaria mercenaria]